MSDDEWVREIKDALELREREIRAEFRDKGRDFLGRRGVLAQSPFDFPARPAPKKQAGDIKPRVASRKAPIRIAALKLLKTFLEEYRRALALYREGVKNVVFPAGTYKMRKLFNVLCAPATAPP